MHSASLHTLPMHPCAACLPVQDVSLCVPPMQVTSPCKGASTRTARSCPCSRASPGRVHAPVQGVSPCMLPVHPCAGCSPTHPRAGCIPCRVQPHAGRISMHPLTGCNPLQGATPCRVHPLTKCIPCRVQPRASPYRIHLLAGCSPVQGAPHAPRPPPPAPLPRPAEPRPLPAQRPARCLPGAVGAAGRTRSPGVPRAAAGRGRGRGRGTGARAGRSPPPRRSAPPAGPAAAMGSLLSRRIAGVEDIDIQANSAYRYPPKSGNYFASHFFMGGEKFDTPHPEGYLFGENMDLNFLGNRPVQFPYVTPAPHEPVKTLRSLVNIRKDSLRLVRYKDDVDSPTEENGKQKVLYSLEFTFDADARVAITIYCQATEEFVGGMAVYSTKNPSLQSETVHYKRGVSQQFSLPSFKIDFSDWKDDELNFDLDRGVFPVVIRAVVDEGDVVVEVTGHAHVLLAAFEKVDRVSYLLQEIYGIENKNNQETKPSDDENSDNSNECVVCLSDLRDTLILPCRHLCLCNSCADTLRYQANNCPICRLPFRALLQIRAVRKKPGALSPVSFSPVLAQSVDHDEHSCLFKPLKVNTVSLPSRKPRRETSSDNIPPGYEPISLLEALNGLRSVSPSIPSAPLYEEINYSGVVDGMPPASRPLVGMDRAMESSHQKGKRSKSPDSTLRSPSSPIHEEDEEKLSEDSDSQPALGGGELVLRETSSPESVAGEEIEEALSLQQGSCPPSVEDVLQDGGCGEHRSLTQPETDPPVDVYLPALGPDSCSIGIEE
uniref:E3 ubiquitin-protein ligase n=1 Tax=Anser brachyrhynchus TaxID=132585 RepID=A0A8B9CZ10_9AVES